MAERKGSNTLSSLVGYSDTSSSYALPINSTSNRRIESGGIIHEPAECKVVGFRKHPQPSSSSSVYQVPREIQHQVLKYLNDISTAR